MCKSCGEGREPGAAEEEGTEKEGEGEFEEVGGTEADRITKRGKGTKEVEEVHRQPWDESDAADGHAYDVLHFHGFLDDERFAVLHADEVAVEARDSAEARFYFRV